MKQDWKLRFIKYIQPVDTGCFLWTGTVKRNTGYGWLKVEGKVKSAHRISWEIAYGPIPEGLHVCHKCDNRLCVNPAHLFVGTAKDNMQDAAQKGRMNCRRGPNPKLRGMKNHQSKLTDQAVMSLRSKFASGGISKRTLAKEFGISANMAGRIINRQSWNHI